MRTSAIRWVYEAQMWLSGPDLKSYLSIQSLQTNILLLIAREIAGVGEGTIWISVGSLFRTAVFMGLHRDPIRLPKRSTLITEMRRRLWNTILETTLHSSMTCGGPVLVSLSEFDTEPPGNFDDEQLGLEDPVPEPIENHTQASIAIALRKTFPIRLAIAKFLNDLGSHGTYEETLRLDAELRTAYKVLCQTLQRRSSNIQPGSEARLVDFIMHRYFSALHTPCFHLALHETAYAFSRKVVVETSVKIWHAALPTSSDLARLATCGQGSFRTTVLQASFLIAMELEAQLREEAGLGPVTLRPDLLTVLDDAKVWSLRCIEIGETNIKGYLLIRLVVAQIECLLRGIENGKPSQLLIDAAEEAKEKCLAILEEKAAQGHTGGITDTAQAPDPFYSSELPQPLEDWDFMVGIDATPYYCPMLTFSFRKPSRYSALVI